MSTLTLVKIASIFFVVAMAIGVTLLVMACGKLEKRLGINSDEEQMLWIKEYRERDQRNTEESERNATLSIWNERNRKTEEES